MLQPLDLLVSLKLVALNDGAIFSLEELARELFISPSSVSRSTARATDAGLLSVGRKPKRKALLEFVLYGVPYVYYVKPGETTRGMPTAHAAPPLSNIIGGGEVPVWPYPLGEVRGHAVAPLHKSVPAAARRDSRLYELLALVDALRIGRARERRLAAEELRCRIEA